jgi:hypothetical protein
MLRDGVSEGRTAEVMRWPIGHVAAVWRKLGPEKSTADIKRRRERKRVWDRRYKAARAEEKRRAREMAP